MSSDSEIDEFYDAEDVTPAKPSSPPESAENAALDESYVPPELRAEEEEESHAVAVLSSESDLEKEEQLLHEAELLAEKRRREEDEEIQRRKADLEKRKQMEREKQEAAVKAEENEKRRQRLKQMRELMEGGSDTSNRPPPKPPRTYEDVLQPSTSVEPVQSDSDGSTDDNTPTSEDAKDTTLNCNLQSTANYDKIQHKVIPQLILTGEEPDIIQSTKASSLERERKLPPPRPVAPPRKKKPKNLGDDASGVDELELETPTSTAYSLTQELEASLSSEGRSTPPSVYVTEESLDINSATKGHRIVTALEESSAKAEMTSLEKELNAEELIGAVGGEDPSKLTEMFTVKLGLKNSREGKLHKLAGGNVEVREIPLSMQRPRSNSGSRLLTDEEILESVMVLNLDTGEKVPLNKAEEKIPICINPLSLQIMRRTKEYSSDSSLHKNTHASDEEGEKVGDPQVTSKTLKTIKVATNKKRKRIKKLIGKTVHKIRSVADEVFHGEVSESDDDDTLDERRMIKVRASNSHKGPYDFDLLVPVQDLGGQHTGAIWTMEFSHCGRLLATGGQDNLLRIWVLKGAYPFFDDMRQKYSEATKAPSPAHSHDSLNSHNAEAASDTSSNCEPPFEDEEEEHAPFMKKPFCIYKGHTADLLDISWSKNFFILSSSMDKTVRLWHVSRKECLCCFQHIDFVTAIAFHPKDDRYFLSGSLDGKLRLWNIPDKKVALWNEVNGQTKLITVANFLQSGRLAVVGTYDGRCIFYNTEQLKYNTQINVKSTRGKNRRGRKITGIEPLPGENKILITSNDSRIRLYDLRDQTLTCKYRGCANNSSQIKASFSHDGKYIISGSEDRYVYIWKTQHDFYKFSSARRDRNDYWEGIKAHNAVVTSAIFAPKPSLIIKPQFEFLESEDEGVPAVRGEVLVSADYNGSIKIFINKFKPGSG